jgi:gas vesicle protein
VQISLHVFRSTASAAHAALANPAHSPHILLNASGLQAFPRNHLGGDNVNKNFLVGLGIGVGLGMLLAPMSGEETRNNLRERANDLADQAREAMNQGRDRINRGIEQVKGNVQNVASDVSSKFGSANEPTSATGTAGSRNL